jgi:hypothetical protein
VGNSTYRLKAEERGESYKNLASLPRRTLARLDLPTPMLPRITILGLGNLSSLLPRQPANYFTLAQNGQKFYFYFFTLITPGTP